MNAPISNFFVRLILPNYILKLACGIGFAVGFVSTVLRNINKPEFAFFKGCLIAMPISIGLWILIIWAVFKIF